jgi:hypothetical protein
VSPSALSGKAHCAGQRRCCPAAMAIDALASSCCSFDDDWASGRPLDTTEKLLLVASESNPWASGRPLHPRIPKLLLTAYEGGTLETAATLDTREILLAASEEATPEASLDAATEHDREHASSATGQLPALTLSETRPCDKKPASDVPTPRPPSLPLVRTTEARVRPQRPIRAQNLKSASPETTPRVDRVSVASPPKERRAASAPPPRPSGVGMAPPPKSTTGVRRARYEVSERAHMMAPMLRARHMAILDEQYLNDQDNRAHVGSCLKPCAPSSARGRPRISTPCGSGVEEDGAASRRPLSHLAHRRLRGPKAAMPLVKGQIKVRSEIARREADQDAREARLKDQFRSRLTPRLPSCCPAKSEPQSSNCAASGGG